MKRGINKTGVKKIRLKKHRLHWYEEYKLILMSKDIKETPKKICQYSV